MIIIAKYRTVTTGDHLIVVAAAGSVGLPKNSPRIDITIDERSSKFFAKCLNDMFDRKAANRLSINRMTTCLAALLSFPRPRSLQLLSI